MEKRRNVHYHHTGEMEKRRKGEMEKTVRCLERVAILTNERVATPNHATATPTAWPAWASEMKGS